MIVKLFGYLTRYSCLVLASGRGVFPLLIIHRRFSASHEVDKWTLEVVNDIRRYGLFYSCFIPHFMMRVFII